MRMQITVLPTSLLYALGQVYVPLSYNSRGRRFSSRGHLRDIFPNHCADHSMFEYREINIISGGLLRTVLFELAFSYVISVTDYNKHLLSFCLIPIKTVRFIFFVVKRLVICVVVFVYIFSKNICSSENHG